MQLVYTNPEQTTIMVTLDEGENLDDLAGPTVAHVPTDPSNRHYAMIVEQGLPIIAFAPPAQLPTGS
jgi:hypothetical protein